MPRKNKTDRELGWLRNVWEELAAIELRHQCFCTITLNPGAQRSVFYVTLRMERKGAPEGVVDWAYTSKALYPTGDATEFLAWLWWRADRFGDEIALSDPQYAPKEKKRG